MKRVKYKRRRAVEIYFVLYLAALVFLIPKPGENGEEASKSEASSALELPFTLRPEKSVLFCRVVLDSVPMIVHLDSVNTIFHTGDVDDIGFEFVVEDQVYKHKVRLASDIEQTNRYFSISRDFADNTADFRWLPPIDDKINKSYIVYVFASGKEKSTGNEISARTQFILVVNYYDKDTGMPVAAEEVPVIADGIPYFDDSRPSLGDFTLSLQHDIVQTIAYQDWENQVFILGGLNPLNDLLKNPDLKITHTHENSGGSAYISNYFSNGIVISGKSPSFGSMNVTISLKRRYDNKEASVSFRVVPQAIGSPDIAQEMFPGVTYHIKPNLPFIAGQEIKALLKEGERIRATSVAGENFSFAPQIQDTGKILYLERYINNSIIGQKYRVTIKNYPPPVIVKSSLIGSRTVLLQTNSYGYHSNRENTVATIELSGNAQVKERFGQYRADRNNALWTQFFEITPKDNSKPFVFKAKAVDRRGVRSEAEEYDSN